MATVDADVQIVRDLTDEEISTFEEKGWVFVKNYVSRAHVAKMLERGKECLGVSDGNEFSSKKDANDQNWRSWWWQVGNISKDEDLFAAVGQCPKMGQNIERLFRRNVGVRFFSDALMAKVPVDQEGGSVATSWHQDLPSFPVDRSGTMAFWMALDHLTPDMGTMHFLEGSHRGELCGRKPLSDDPEAIFEYAAYIREKYKEVSSPTFEPGDATFHHCHMLHGAPANTGRAIRWSYAAAFLASDCRYSGASCMYTDNLDMPIDAPIRHPKFPEIWPGRARGS